MMCTAYQYRAAWFVRSMVTLAMPMVGFSMVHMAKFREEPSQRWGSLLCAEPENGLESAFSLLEITCAPPGPSDPGPALGPPDPRMQKPRHTRRHGACGTLALVSVAGLAVPRRSVRAEAPNADI